MTTYDTERPACLPIDVPSADHEGSVPVETFRSAFRMHPSGIAVVTAEVDGQPTALTVSSLSSVSAEPPLVVFSVSSRASSSPVLRRARSVVLHLVGSEQLWLAKLAATSGVDRFADTTAWTRLPTGEPVFTAVPVWLRGTVISQIDAGDATLFIVHVVSAEVPDDESFTRPTPLVYHGRSWHRLDENSRVA